MSTQVSMPIKIFALIGGVLALGLGAMTMMKGSPNTSGAAVATPVVTHPTVTTTPPAATRATPAPVAAHPVAKPAASKPAKPKPKPLPAVAADGLPMQLEMLLHIHRVVVVAVYDPEIPTDMLFLAEARAGAQDAHAGFLAVSVLNERLASPLTKVAGNGSLLPSPGVLIYKPPAVLMNTLTGFVDRGAVAEAVANALLADAPTTSTSSTTATTPYTSAPPAVAPTVTQ